MNRLKLQSGHAWTVKLEICCNATPQRENSSGGRRRRVCEPALIAKTTEGSQYGEDSRITRAAGRARARVARRGRPTYGALGGGAPGDASRRDGATTIALHDHDTTEFKWAPKLVRADAPLSVTGTLSESMIKTEHVGTVGARPRRAGFVTCALGPTPACAGVHQPRRTMNRSQRPGERALHGANWRGH